jgi:MFS family permease
MFAVAGWPMWLGSTIGSAVGGATIPSLGVLNPELFPTSRRGLANGLLNLAAVIGSVGGLLLVGQLVGVWGYGTTIAAVGIGPLVVILLLRWIPEGARRELEDLNPVDNEVAHDVVGSGGSVGTMEAGDLSVPASRATTTPPHRSPGPHP